MGCWNGTCALTNLPIHDGERVVLFVLNTHAAGYDSDFGGGIVEPHVHANPVGPALRGTYNGYGGVTNLEGPALAWWTTHLAELAPLLMNNESESLSFDSLDDLINNNEVGIERGGVYLGIPGLDMDGTRLALMLVHEAAYDRFMVTAIASDDWLFEDASEDAVTHYLKDLRRRASLLADFASGTVQLYQVYDGYRMVDGFESILRYAQENEATELLEETARLKIFDMMLGCARKSWGRQCGAGSGNADMSLQVEMARFTLEYAGAAD